MTTIVLIGKHPIVHIGLRYILKDRFTEALILEAGNIVTFRHSYPGARPDLVILSICKDQALPLLSIVAKIKKREPACHIILFEEEPDPENVHSYLKTGVEGYLSKQNSVAELRECIDEVSEGRYYVCKELRETLWNDGMDKKHAAGTEVLSLTSKEHEIVKYLCQGMKTSWIAQKLGKKSSTISTYKFRIFQKLAIDNVLQLRDAIERVEVRKKK
ncbi:Transcriptional activator protein ExaE [Dyadobacter sp. CECT 9275]|uniref:Transcriptional activator protein ExaE n=1 Tax=Dyadobacter helix TaxID=2822344 RepID=A0A916NMN6_9BACT|nr:response regulator transcription factor [Dyadobacter sp. CECT 9275]CAG5007717.1 Transcriptional activator protein ExaE [Dyadobacter sp. CECT 9275]